MDAREREGKEKELQKAAKKGVTGRVQQLLAEGVNPDAGGGYRQGSSLHKAAYHGHHGTVSALLRAGADVNAWDNKQSKRTPLHKAAERGHHETVSVLLKAGADVDARNEWEYTALHLAAIQGHPKCAEILLQHGADTGIKNEKGRTAEGIAADENTWGSFAQMKHQKERVTRGRKEILELFREHKDQWKALHKAAYNGQHETVSALLSSGADVNTRDNKQKTPLHLAAENGHHETVSALLTAFADVNARDNEESTPLHDAASRGHPKCVEILLQHGADTSIRNKKGRTAEDIAADGDTTGAFANNKDEEELIIHGRKEILRLLREQNNRVSKRKKGFDPVLVRYFEKGMTKAKKDCPLIKEAAKESGKTEEQTFIGNYRKSLDDKKRRQSTDDTAAGYSGFTGYHEDSGMSDEDIRNNDYEREGVSQSQNEILKLPRQQKDGISKRKKGYDPVLVRFYEERGMTVAKKDCPLIEEAAKKSGKTVKQVRNFIANYRRRQAFGEGSLPTDDMAAGNSGFTGSHNSGMSEESDELEETMEEVLSEQEESHTETLSRTHEAVEQYSDRNNPTDEGETSQVQLADGPLIVRSEASQIQPKKGGKRKSKTRHIGESSESGTLTKRPKQAVAQPGPITIAKETENSIRITWTEAAGTKDSYSISISPTDGITAPSVRVNPGDPLEHTFTGLTAGTEYTISVVTVSGGAKSPPTTKTQRTTVAQPGAIKITEVTENSIRTTWTAAAGAKDSYRISISPDTGVITPCVSVNAGDPLKHTFSGLTAGTEYTISVVAISGGVNSVARTATKRTNAAKPGPVTIAEVTENRITWTEAAGTKDSYRISISPTDGVTASSSRINSGHPLEHTFTTLTAGTEYTISAVTVSGGECSDPTIKVQRTKFTSVLLVNYEYGTSHGGPSTTNRQVAQFLQRHGATVHATAVKASEEDERCATEDNVTLHLPVQEPRDKRTPSLEWLTYYHSIHYLGIPQDLKCIVGHAGVSSEAAKSIQKTRCQQAKLVLFNHDIPEETEHYKGAEKAMTAGKKMEDILEDAKNADAVFSLGRRIYDYFETKYMSLGESKPGQHFLFLPRPSPVFEAISVRPGGGQKVVLSVGRVTEVDKLKGHDLIARSLGEVAQKITNVSLRVRGIDENDFKASKKILEENLHSGNINPILLPCGTQEDIADDMKQAHWS
ncbi:PREDICTED: ankyrin repeat and KH domain-containing protein mask-like [Branchiostoma belcheri]|uniref:Ankyrin repeat and KH domain-containing protein mask-like n=1 Tax=Branchiostoma belcheri TaxID=7741 RepID=A0A6P4XUA1_BRABE|nr:PREDICTED: ankyrin repeat and KH domain-containing protein mask-like [Branchiostoma belcheri]